MSYGRTPMELCAIIAITNTGHLTINNKLPDFSDADSMRVESPRGWTIGEHARVMLLGDPMNQTVRPGSGMSALVCLPKETLRWQVCYKVSTASLRQRLLSRVPAKWQGWLLPLCNRFVSDKPGPEQEVWSPVFEIPHHELPDWALHSATS